MNTATPSVAQLQRAIQIQEQIEKLEAALKAVLNGSTSVTKPSPTKAGVVTKSAKKKGKMSAKGRANIIAAQKARWATIKSRQPTPAVAAKTPKAGKKGKRNISPEARAKMAAAAKKRWAKVKE